MKQTNEITHFEILSKKIQVICFNFCVWCCSSHLPPRTVFGT